MIKYITPISAIVSIKVLDVGSVGCSNAYKEKSPSDQDHHDFGQYEKNGYCQLTGDMIKAYVGRFRED